MCVDSVLSAVNAEKGGATRLELCGSLVDGGTTPSLGMLRVVKERVNVPVFVMVRPRGGDFLYTEDEFMVMKEDVKIFKDGGADGFVFGILTSDGSIDKERVAQLMSLCRPLPVTFHRAFDMVKDYEESLKTLISLGVDRLLTSGCESTALEGVPTIKRLVELSKKRIAIMAGGGITERNLERILVGTGVQEFHCSARVSQDSSMTFRNTRINMGASYGPPEYCVKIADRERVQRLVSIPAKLKESCH